jgi:hypothetical protein
LPEAARVTLEIYDVRGRRVAVLVAEAEREAGYHTVRFDAEGLASGLYLARLRAGTFTQTQRLMLAR